MANNVHHSIFVKTGDVQQVLDAARELIPARQGIEIHEGLIKFGTKWVPPVEAFESLAARFPNYDIVIHGACYEDCQHFVFELHNGVSVGRDCTCGGVGSFDYPCNHPDYYHPLLLNQNTQQLAQRLMLADEAEREWLYTQQVEEF